MAGRKVIKAQNCAQRIEAATSTRSQAPQGWTGTGEQLRDVKQIMWYVYVHIIYKNIIYIPASSSWCPFYAFGWIVGFQVSQEISGNSLIAQVLWGPRVLFMLHISAHHLKSYYIIETYWGTWPYYGWSPMRRTHHQPIGSKGLLNQMF